MERYETAAIELIDIEEDVITASGSTNTTAGKTIKSCGNHSSGWAVYYDDGTYEIVDELPDACK